MTGRPAAVTTGLLSDLVTRGVPTDRTLLFVIDGAPGLRRAITDVFRSRGVVQRCQVHKCRNVLRHLPERLHASVGKALRDAWDLDSVLWTRWPRPDRVVADVA